MDMHKENFGFCVVAKHSGVLNTSLISERDAFANNNASCLHLSSQIAINLCSLPHFVLPTSYFLA
jgi:hypothetical protein